MTLTAKMGASRDAPYDTVLVMRSLFPARGRRNVSPGLFMNTYCVGRSSRPARPFSLGLLDVLLVRLRRPHLREATAGFGLSRLATAFLNNPGFWEVDFSKFK